MGLKEKIALKYDQELKVLEDAVKKKEESLEEVKCKLRRYSELEGKYSYLFERADGERVSVHKSGDKIRFFSSTGRDITPRFEDRKGAHRDLVEQAGFLSDKDFVVDCIVVDKGHQEYCFYVSDVLFLEEDKRHFPLEDRKKIIKQLSFSDDFKECPSVKVSEPDEVDSAVVLFEKLGSDKVLAKRLSGPYVTGVSDDAILLEVNENGKTAA